MFPKHLSYAAILLSKQSSEELISYMTYDNNKKKLNETTGIKIR